MMTDLHPNETKRRILIVDDEQSACEMLEDLLSDSYEIETASNADEAISKLNATAFDAALVDYHMPGQNGISVIDVAMKSIAFDRLFLVTADPKQQRVESAIGFIHKPFDARILKLMLHNSFKTQ